ncbi:putative G-protein coupled receptor F59B2.13 [Trichinella sp. T6]|nr:putative G-protein coupled receptor F59B2.13 [Trichinella sp. T6]
MEVDSSCTLNYLSIVPFASVVIGRFVFPIVFVVGVIGNMLILLALKAAAVTTKTSYFLIAMAVADLCFFFCVLPNHMISFSALNKLHSFMVFYIQSKMPLTALANWFSVASIWLAIAVTFERLLAIRKPLHAKLFFKKWHLISLITLIYVASFVSVSYIFFWLTPTEITVNRCNKTQTLLMLKPINETVHPTVHQYVSVSLKVAPHLTCTVPLILLVVLNSLLLYYLRQGRKMSQMVANVNPSRIIELRVTLIVVSIIGTFLICQTPSGVLYVWESMQMNASNNSRPDWFYTAVAVSNILVVCGKAINFAVYCVSSSNFRSKIKRLFTVSKFSKAHSLMYNLKNYTNTTMTQIDPESEMMLSTRRSKDSYTMTKYEVQKLNSTKASANNHVPIAKLDLAEK